MASFTFTNTKNIDIAWPLRTAVFMNDFGRKWVFILQIFCVTLEITVQAKR